MIRYLTLVAVLLLTGCGADTPTADTPAGTPAPTAIPGEGPASQPHTWPDGITARLVRLETIDRKYGAQTAGDETIVKVTAEIGNTSTTPLAVDSDRLWLRILYGANRDQADQDPGFSYSDEAAEAAAPDLGTDKPTRIAAGGDVTVAESYNVPTRDLDELAVWVELPSADGMRMPHTFTDAEKMLRQ